MIHLRFTELFLSPGDVIEVYDPYTNERLESYSETDKLLISVTSESDSARVVFTSAGNQNTGGRRFELVHRALPQGKDVFTHTVAASLLNAYCFG